MIKLFLIIGAPGSGKTTDASLISSKHNNIAHYSTGDMLRDEVKKNGELGKEINKFVLKGDLVPIKIIIDTIISAIHNSDKNIILIDGYPRSVEQMLVLNEILKKETGINLSSVIEVEVSEETAQNRIIGRVNESKEIREDDDINIFKNRMNIYIKPLKEIKSFYKNKKLLKIIDGEQTIEKVVKDMNNYIITFFEN